MKIFYQSLGLSLFALSVVYAHDNQNGSTLDRRKPLASLSYYSTQFNHHQDSVHKRLDSYYEKARINLLKERAENKINSYFQENRLTILEDKEWERVRLSLSSTLKQTTLDKLYQAERQKKEKYLVNYTLGLIEAAMRLKHPSYQWTKPLKIEDLIPFFLNRILQAFPQLFVTQSSAYSDDEKTQLARVLSDIGERYNFSTAVSKFIVDCIWKAHTQYTLNTR